MKRTSAWILALVMVMCPLVALGETSIVVDQKAVKEVGINELIVVDDVLTFWVGGYSFSDKGYFFAQGSPSYSSAAKFYTSGNDYQFLVINCTLINESLSSFQYDKYISDVRVVFRDKYDYWPLYGQKDPNRAHDSYEMYAVAPLVEGYPRFFFDVPNLVETSTEPLLLYLTIDGQPYMCKLR